MLGTTLVYFGLAIGTAGVVCLLRPLRLLRIRTRPRAAVVVGAGTLIAAIGVLLPAPTRRAATAASRLDEVVAAWQFAERHQILVAAPPERVDAAIRQVTAREIRLFRLLTWIRNPGRAWSEQPESLLAAPADRPILDVALDSDFVLLSDEPGREIVIGTLVVVPPDIAALSAAERRRRRDGWTSEWFATLDEPGYAKAAMNFRLEEAGEGRTRVVTETRVAATDDSTRLRFAAYWRLIYPGSALIRRGWLRAIQARAEG